MSQPFIHLPKGFLNSNFFTLSGKDFHHLVRVLRCRKGDKIYLSDGNLTAEAEIIEVYRREAQLKICCKALVEKPASTIALFFSPLKAKRMELLLEKATELGVDELHPVLFERTVVKVQGEKALERWGKIVKSAAEQAHQPVLPEIYPVASFKEAIKALRQYSKTLVFLEDEKSNSLMDLKFEKNERLALVIGPEGGFNESEKKSFRNSNFYCLTLGKQLLRAETASLVALTLASFLLGRRG